MIAKNGTVLFVDDEPAILRSISRELARAPFRALFAESAAEGLRIVSAERVDVVVADLRMPEMDGLEMLDRLRTLAPAVARVILTGNADIDATMRAINGAAVYRFLTKPWTAGSLRAEVLQCLRYAERASSEGVREAMVLDGLERHHPGITQKPKKEGAAFEIELETLDVDVGAFLRSIAY